MPAAACSGQGAAPRAEGTGRTAPTPSSLRPCGQIHACGPTLKPCAFKRNRTFQKQAARRARGSARFSSRLFAGACRWHTACPCLGRATRQRVTRRDTLSLSCPRPGRAPRGAAPALGQPPVPRRSGSAPAPRGTAAPVTLSEEAPLVRDVTVPAERAASRPLGAGPQTGGAEKRSASSGSRQAERKAAAARQPLPGASAGPSAVRGRPPAAAAGKDWCGAGQEAARADPASASAGRRCCQKAAHHGKTRLGSGTGRGEPSVRGLGHHHRHHPPAFGEVGEIRVGP